ncbi:hypothetical protein EGW08_018741 [Elysia chlorotica]|uniref:Little elongation complex subunit 2 C-terminal domain-containing protein n=1 Tax=Elysia chlorotica TaxID=188477 RepID=A0A433SW08_ELYCH|nr:hypothetical protein EGW08_018741 [Elysia chlorotica]
MSQDSETKHGVPRESLLQHAVPEFLQNGRKNPINGASCFFSEEIFRKVVGPEPSFHDKFMTQLARSKEAHNIKVDEKKKRRKDLDLPPNKISDTKELIYSTAEMLSNGLGNSEKSVIANDMYSSDDDDESSAALVIADNEENADRHVDSYSPEKLKDEISMEGVCKQSKTDQVIDITDSHQSSLLPEPSYQIGEIPLYATGIINDRTSSLVKKGKMNVNSQEETPVICSADVTEELHSKPASKDESFCLVMPPTESESEDGDDSPSTQSGSLLPLIPALMSVPTTAKKSHNMANFLKPSATSSFYSSAQTQVFSDPESLSQSQKHNLRQIGNMAPTLEKKDDEGDIEVPIFSLAATPNDASPDARVKKTLRNKGIWSSGQEDKKKEVSQAKDNSAKNAIKFQRSSLTRNQMATYLELFEKYARPYLNGGQHPAFTEKQKREMADFEALQARVQNEQREFQSYLQQNALRNPQFYNFIKGCAKHYAYTKAQSYRPPKNVVIKFSRRFVGEVPLQAGSERVELMFQQHLLEMGSPPRVALPDITPENNPAKIIHNMNKIEQHFPCTGRNKNPGTLHHESVSEDMNAEALAIKYKTNAVMSSSVVKCLLNNRSPEFKRSWNIPITIKEHQIEGGVHKVVYLNKPIYEENLLLRDCNALFHKYALRAMVSQPKHTAVFNRSERQQNKSNYQFNQEKRPVKAADDPFDMFATDLDSLETFGKTSFGKKDNSNEPVKLEDVINGDTNCRRSKRIAEGHADKDNMSQADSVKEDPHKTHLDKQIADDAISQHDRLEKSSLDPQALNKSNNTEREETTSSLRKKARGEVESLSLNREESLSQSTRLKRRVPVLKSPTSSTSTDYQPLKPQLSFHNDSLADRGNLLDLILGPDVGRQEKKTNVSHTQENPKLYTPHSEVLSSLVYSQWELGQNKILIRTRSQGNLGTRNVYFAAKLEYQSNHGLEQVTSEEMIQNWAACYIRPNCKLIRARINAFTSEILMFEELECHQILKPSSSFRPMEGFSFINNVLTQLSSLEQGHYLLSHEPGMNFCGIRTLKQGARLDTIEMPLPVPPERKLSMDSVPWIPIDPNLLLPYHIKHQRIPATFLPRDVEVVPGSKKKPPQAKVTSNFTNKKKKKKKKFQKNKEREFF